MDYERGLSAQLLTGLREIKGIQVYGITDQQQLAWRVPTIACNIEGHSPRELAEQLASSGVFAWDGNYDALGIMERLGLEEKKEERCGLAWPTITRSTRLTGS